MPGGRRPGSRAPGVRRAGRRRTRRRRRRPPSARAGATGAGAASCGCGAGKAMRRPGRPSCSMRCRMRACCRARRSAGKTRVGFERRRVVDLREQLATSVARAAGTRRRPPGARRPPAGTVPARHDLDQPIVGEVSAVHTADLSVSAEGACRRAACAACGPRGTDARVRWLRSGRAPGSPRSCSARRRGRA